MVSARTPERDYGAESVGTHFKIVRLMSPEWARKINLRVETPVLVSPYVEGKEHCDKCGETFEPIIYRHGGVLAHHFHETGGEAGGGIYSQDSVDPDYLDTSVRLSSRATGWVAILSPSGRVVQDDPTHIRSEFARVQEFRAYCYVGDEQIKSGILVTFGTSSDDMLLPVCPTHESDWQPILKPVGYAFEITDEDEVLFRKI